MSNVTLNDRLVKGSDEVFLSYAAATQGVEIENTGSGPWVGLRYFGPNTHDDLPAGGT